MSSRTIGARGEELVKQILIKQGWQILKQNWHLRQLEIDLLAYHSQTKVLLIVEVKTTTRKASFYTYSQRQRARTRKHLRILWEISKHGYELRHAVAYVNLIPRTSITWFFEDL